VSRIPKPLTVERIVDGARYISLEGDVLDHLCWRHYGYEWDTTEAVLEANRGLAAHGVVLPAGVIIFFPHIVAAPVRKERRRLFD
jgi:phage tail protein X